MKRYTIGTSMVIGGGVLAIILKSLGVSNSLSTIIFVAVCTAGFVIQMYSAYKMNSASQKHIKEQKEKHQTFMKKISDLPSEENDEAILERLKTEFDFWPGSTMQECKEDNCNCPTH